MVFVGIGQSDGNGGNRMDGYFETGVVSAVFEYLSLGTVFLAHFAGRDCFG